MLCFTMLYIILKKMYELYFNMTTIFIQLLYLSPEAETVDVLYCVIYHIYRDV